MYEIPETKESGNCSSFFLSGMNENEYMGNGVLQSEIDDAERCLLSCVTERHCFALDFDTLEKKCFFHDLD